MLWEWSCKVGTDLQKVPLTCRRLSRPVPDQPGQSSFTLCRMCNSSIWQGNSHLGHGFLFKNTWTHKMLWHTSCVKNNERNAQKLIETNAPVQHVSQWKKKSSLVNPGKCLNTISIPSLTSQNAICNPTWYRLRNLLLNFLKNKDLEVFQIPFQTVYRFKCITFYDGSIPDIAQKGNKAINENVTICGLEAP